MIELPKSGAFDGAVLGRALDSLTASYKISLAKSIFTHVASGGGEMLAYGALLDGMLRAMWLPVARYRLRLGHSDKTAGHFERVPEEIQLSGSFEEALPFIDRGVNGIRNSLLRYPVGVFLAPWFREAGVAFQSADMPAYHAVTRDRARGFYLPYEIHPKGILLDRAFMDYVAGNLALLDGWTDMRLVDYLQSRNPNIPAIPLKIRPQERSGLAVQRDWWADLIQDGSFRCIYIGEPVWPDSFHLDHFLPWRFVAHDRIWNLVPAAPGLNLSKGAGIPEPGLVPKIAEVHLAAVRKAAQTPRIGKDLLEEYVDDLGIDPSMLYDEQSFLRGYQDTVLPLLTLARRRFPAWRYDGLESSLLPFAKP